MQLPCNSNQFYIMTVLFWLAHYAFGMQDIEVIYAVNAGSETATTDSQGIRYEADTTAGSVPCSAAAKIKEMPVGDQKLYEHVLHGIFGFGFKFTGDGYYTIVLKFAECWNAAVGQRTFDVLLNQRKVIEKLDLTKEGGLFTVYTVNLRFSVCDGKFFYNDGETVPVINKYVRIDFVPVAGWHPIVNALVVLKQKAIDEDLPKVLRPTKQTNAPFYECKVLEGSQKTMMGERSFTLNNYGNITFNIFHGPEKTEMIVNTELE